MQSDRFGIYLNVKDSTVMRINSPYWIPSGDEWVFLTDDVNSPLTKIRELAGERGLIDDPTKVMWGDWSRVPRRE
jgi:hypothetical protein